MARSSRRTPAARSKASGGKEGYFGTSEHETLEETELEEADVEDLDYRFKPSVPPPSIALPVDATYDPRAPSPVTTPSVGTPIIMGTGPRVTFSVSPTTTLSPTNTLLAPSTSGTGADAIRLKRKARLAIKLQEVFGLKEVEEVLAEMPCWLLRSVLLQGYMYLTSHHLCFFAHMPSREVCLPFSIS